MVFSNFINSDTAASPGCDSQPLSQRVSSGNPAERALCAREPAGRGAVGLSLQLLYCHLGAGAWAAEQERAHLTFGSVVTRTHCAVGGGGSRA